jgi:hydrogenase maturation protease
VSEESANVQGNGERIVVLGVGNILLRDEGVGVRAVEELQRRYGFPDNVSVVDGGTQGLWLLSTLQECDHLIVLDAVMGKSEPGAIYRLTGDDLPKGLRAKQSAHDSDLVECLNLCKLIEVGPQTCVVLGVQPADIQPFGLELTERVAGSIESLLDRALDELKALGVTPAKKDLNG